MIGLIAIVVVDESRSDAFDVRPMHRVLVVDDHPDTAEVLSMMFQMLGHETRAVTRGRDALHAAREFDPELVLVDIGLPDISGYEVVNALRADPRARARFIVAVSGWTRPQDIAHAHRAGFDSHFAKPLDLRKIRQILRAVSEPSNIRSEDTIRVR